MYPYQNNSIMIIFILLIMFCCCSYYFYIIIIGVYIYYYSSEPDGYKKYSRTCVSDHNLGNRYRDISVNDCAELCNERDDCVAFEVYEDHDGDGWDGLDNFVEGDCQLNSNYDPGDITSCPGERYNMNLYVKETT